MVKWYDSKAVVFRPTYSSMQSVTTKNDGMLRKGAL